MAERLAGDGLRFNRFHTTALCAPSRQALLTGRNHHSVGMGSITETATSAPGNSSVRPNTKAPLAITLKFTHVIVIAPTVLEAAGLLEPTMVNGVQQSPMEGTSKLYTFKGPEAPERHDLQYFEMFANRGVYHKGWSAVTKHRTPWVMVGGCPARVRR